MTFNSLHAFQGLGAAIQKVLSPKVQRISLLGKTKTVLAPEHLVLSITTVTRPLSAGSMSQTLLNALPTRTVRTTINESLWIAGLITWNKHH